MNATKKRPRRSLWKSTLGTLLATSLALAVTGCGSDSDDALESKDGKTVIKVGVYPLHVSLPIWAAVDQGFFEDEGLDVKITNVTSGPVMLSALSSNSIDLMLNSPSNAIAANAKGLDLKLVSTTVPQTINNVLATNDLLDTCEYAAAAYPEPYRCAKGKKIGILALGSESHLVALTELKQVGLGDRDVTFVPVGSGEGAAKSLETGQADIVFGEDVTAIYATNVSKVARPLVDLKKIGTFADWMGNGVWGSASRLEKDAEAYEKFATAIETSIAWLNDPANAADSERIYQKYSTTSSAESVKAVVAGTPAYFGTTATCSSIANISSWMVATDLLAAAKEPKDCAELAFSTAEFSRN